MSFPEIEPRAAFERLQGFRIVDVREEHEYHGPHGRLEAAEFIPLSKVANHAAQLSDRPLLLICRSGQRSGKACDPLQKLGVDSVTDELQQSGAPADLEIAVSAFRKDRAVL